ncbi:MAG: reverse transcriptase/maturase family protein [Candidatus Uhrbacteria bacterium]
MFEQIVTTNNLFLAWELFRNGKRRREDVMLFEKNLEDNIFQLQNELTDGYYYHSQYTPFTIHDPKQRTIHKALVRDRVVHQAIVNVIELLFEKRFIFDSYSCRVGKGTHAAVKRLRFFLRQASENNTKTVYAVKCDIKKFFASVNHAVLLELLTKRIHDQKTMAVIRNIVRSFSTTPETGIPLGNLTSQLFANIYLHELDWFVKQKLGLKHYVRYCDDFVILAQSISEGMELAKKIDTFLQSRLKVRLHPDKVFITTWTQGVDFLGYVILPEVILVRPTTAKRAIYRSDRNNFQSYLGFCSHADAYEIECIIRNKVGSDESIF